MYKKLAKLILVAPLGALLFLCDITSRDTGDGGERAAIRLSRPAGAFLRRIAQRIRRGAQRLKGAIGKKLSRAKSVVKRTWRRGVKIVKSVASRVKGAVKKVSKGLNSYWSGSRKWMGYGNWCGKGGAGKPIDDLDQACMAHDKCYESYAETHKIRKWYGTFGPCQCDEVFLRKLKIVKPALKRKYRSSKLKYFKAWRHLKLIKFLFSNHKCIKKVVKGTPVWGKTGR